MITINEWLEAVEYRVTDGYPYRTDELGEWAYSYDCHVRDEDEGDSGYELNITFDRLSKEVYEVSAQDYRNNLAYRYRNPKYKAKLEGKNPKNESRAWDNVYYTDLNSVEEWSQQVWLLMQHNREKMVEVPLDIPEHVLFELMKEAHERDITLNELVADIIQKAAQEDTGQIGDLLGE